MKNLDKSQNTTPNTSQSDIAFKHAKEVMTESQSHMDQFLGHFDTNRERLQKYMELSLFRDRATPYSYQSRKSLRRVAVVLSTLCNLDCAWCHRKEDRVQKYLEKNMPFETLQKLLPELEGFEWLHYGGLGEPLMYPQIYEAISLAKKYVTKVKTTTNATKLTPKNCQRLAESGLDLLEVSIDGFDGQANKEWRGVDEGILIDRVRHLSENSDIEIQINTVVSKNNLNSLYNAIDKLHDIKNVSTLHSIPLFMTKWMQEAGIEEVSSEEHKALLNHWKKRIKELGSTIKLYPDVVESKIIDPGVSLKRDANLCFTPYEDPIINVNGNLAPCGRLQDWNLDNVLELGFDKAWNGPKIVRFRESHLKGNFCMDCQRECHMLKTYKVEYNA